ncbi:hypothetical protein U3516DRAFT_732284 [Neocallimastix sp. 'constans']
MTRRQIKYDNAVQSIISGSLDLESKANLKEINNSNYILYLNELKNLYEQYDIEIKQTEYRNNNIQNKPNNSRNRNNKNIKIIHYGHSIEECYYNPFNKNNKNKNTTNIYNNNKNNINNQIKFHSSKINEYNSEYSSNTNYDYISFTRNISLLQNNINYHGTGLNLTNNINQLNNIQNSNDKNNNLSK